MKIGVLGLQGAVREHAQILSRIGVETLIVKRVEQLSEVSGLILPGGESTAISLIGGEPFMDRLREMGKSDFPMFGTCAGMILLASEIEGQEGAHVGVIDITVARNASGRQVHSFETLLEVEGVGSSIPAVFIRAPYITRLGDGVSVLAEHDGHAVMARQGNVVVSSFHPELTDDLRIHEYFLNIVAKRNQEDSK